jgi:tetratricopeptide (TPR) repeat protein
LLRAVSTHTEALVRQHELVRLEAESDRDAIVLVGGSGSGKTVLLHLLRGRDPKGQGSIVDADSPANRTRLGLAAACIGASSSPRADNFLHSAAKARVEGTHKATAEALKAFTECLPELAQSQGAIYIDNIDRAPDQSVSWLTTTVRDNGGPRIVAAAKNDEDVPDHFRRFHVGGLAKPQIDILVEAWTAGREINRPELVTYVDQICEGNAVLAALATWAALQSGRLDGWSGTSLQLLIEQAVAGMSEASRAAWNALVTARHRITQDIVSLLAGSAAAASFRREIANLPILRKVAAPLDGFALHQLARQRIAVGLAIPNSEQSQLLSKLVGTVYPRLLSTELDPTAVARMNLERLQYRIDFDVEVGTSHLEDAFHNAVLGGNYATAEELSRVAEDAQAAAQGNASTRLKLLAAECALILHSSDKAFDVLASVSARRLTRESPELRLRHSLLKARCATSPSPSKHITVFDAVTLLEGGLMTASQEKLDELCGEIRFELAEALQLVARNKEAAKLYQEIAENSGDDALRTRALEELSYLYRDMQRLDDAMTALQSANAIRIEQGRAASGTATYYLANLYRDRNEFGKADNLYRHAEGQFIDADDIYQLCCLYGDFAWMKFLGEDVVASKILLEKYRSLAVTYNFGRELSEYWHIEYHLAMEEGDEARALAALGTAIKLGFQHGNVYMQLDCLMHKVQASVRQGNIDAALSQVRQMREIELLGAEINVFRGRALVALGDGYHAAECEGEAADYWCEGLEIVARFGNSRTNVELLEDLVTPRLDQLRQLEQRLGRPSWPSDHLMQQLPALRLAALQSAGN